AYVLAGCANLEKRDVDLYLPKFKLAPPTFTLAKQFEALGMKTAFDQPKGSANFDKIAQRKPDDYLYISQIFHKTFIAVDEQGTEAAAATAVAMLASSAMRQASPPIEVKVDRPFVYAIQHVPSGVCLFLGHVIDPRSSGHLDSCKPHQHDRGDRRRHFRCDADPILPSAALARCDASIALNKPISLARGPYG